MITVGIDPGFTGAIAALGQDPCEIIALIDMPLIAGAGKIKSEADSRAIVDFLQGVQAFGPVHVFIERVSAMPGQGVTSSFRFGVSYGTVKALPSGLGLPITLLTPQTWQGAVNLPKAPDKASRKNLSRHHAAQLFPKFASHFSRVKDSGRADAVLIALAGQKTLA